jgi:hypothetical protein
LEREDFIRVPSPAAKMTTAATGLGAWSDWTDNSWLLTS